MSKLVKGTNMTEKQLQEVTTEDTEGGSTLKVISPPVLKNIIGPEGHIPSALANFGHVKYGQTFVSELYLPEDNLDGCNDFSADKNLSSEPFKNHKGFIFVKEGNCPVTTKVRNI